MTNSNTKADSKLTQSLRRAKNQTSTANKPEETKGTATKKVATKPTTASKKAVVKKTEPVISVSERVWPD